MDSQNNHRPPEMAHNGRSNGVHHSTDGQHFAHTPAAILAEQGILGAMMTDNNFIDELRDRGISAEMFYTSNNRVLYRAICDTYNNEGHADQVNVTMHMLNNEKLNLPGFTPANIAEYVSKYVGALHSDVNPRAYVDTYTTGLIESYKRRRLENIGEQIKTGSVDPAHAQDLLAELQAIDQPQANGSEGHILPHQYLTGHDFLTYDAPKIVWSIEEFLTEGSNIMFYGETGHGKSIGALYLACCVAAGHPYFDRQVKPGPVAYMQEDQTNIGLDITRAKHFLSHFTAQEIETWKTNWQYWPRREFNIKDPAHVQALETDLQTIRPAFLFFDMITTAIHDLDESKPNDWLQAERAIYNIKKKIDLPTLNIVFLHHTNKDREAKGNNKARGSLALLGKCDHAIHFTKSKDETFTATDTKHRPSTATPPVRFRPGDDFSLMETATDEAASTERTDADIEADILATLNGQAVTKTKIRKAVKGNNTRITKTIDRLLENGELETVKTDRGGHPKIKKSDP